jgi:hypothetical protein
MGNSSKKYENINIELVKDEDLIRYAKMSIKYGDIYKFYGCCDEIVRRYNNISDYYDFLLLNNHSYKKIDLLIDIIGSKLLDNCKKREVIVKFVDDYQVKVNYFSFGKTIDTPLNFLLKTKIYDIELYKCLIEKGCNMNHICYCQNTFNYYTLMDEIHKEYVFASKKKKDDVGKLRDYLVSTGGFTFFGFVLDSNKKLKII